MGWWWWPRMRSPFVFTTASIRNRSQFNHRYMGDLLRHPSRRKSVRAQINIFSPWIRPRTSRPTERSETYGVGVLRSSLGYRNRLQISLTAINLYIKPMSHRDVHSGKRKDPIVQWKRETCFVGMSRGSGRYSMLLLVASHRSRKKPSFWSLINNSRVRYVFSLFGCLILWCSF